jgi:hypothetical protein
LYLHFQVSASLDYYPLCFEVAFAVAACSAAVGSVVVYFVVACFLPVDWDYLNRHLADWLLDFRPCFEEVFVVVCFD